MPQNHEKIYIYRTIGSGNTLIATAYPFIILFLIILFIVTDFINIMNEDENDLLLMLTAFMGFLGSYYTRTPQIQIDSLHLFIYTYKMERYSTKIEDIHHFSITENSIILHGKKVVSIPFSEFEGVDIIGFATVMNDIIAKNFCEVLLSKNRMIQGFSFLVLEGKNIHDSYRQQTIDSSFFLGKGFLIMMIVLMLAISLVDLLPLFISK